MTAQYLLVNKLLHKYKNYASIYMFLLALPTISASNGQST